MFLAPPTWLGKIHMWPCFESRQQDSIQCQPSFADCGHESGRGCQANSSAPENPESCNYAGSASMSGVLVLVMVFFYPKTTEQLFYGKFSLIINMYKNYNGTRASNYPMPVLWNIRKELLQELFCPVFDPLCFYWFSSDLNWFHALWKMEDPAV